MNELIHSLISTLLTPVAFGLAVATAWLMRGWIRDIVKLTGLIEFEVTKEGVKGKFNPEAFAREAFRKQGMGEPSPEDMKEVAGLVRSFKPFVAGRRILWVDNHPENNRLERTALVGWGVDVQTRRSTEEAMVELRERRDTPFDLVISDWFRGRRPEGKRLAELARAESMNVPIIFYFSVDRSNPGLFEEIKAIARGLDAVGATSSPRELLRWTFSELVRAALRDERTEFDLQSPGKLTVTR